MAFLTEKDLKSKFREKKLIFKPGMLIQEENYESKPKKIGLNKAYFWCTLLQAVKVKLFLKMFI